MNDKIKLQEYKEQFEICSHCKSPERYIDLTHEVINNENFSGYFRRFIQCKTCGSYVFLDRNRRGEIF